ncbi:MAG: hypothetical protein M0024_01770 [Nitrospiraceae bacterium]|nr:hypothetical protein [Nitrospiraceae bacterium]
MMRTKSDSTFVSLLYKPLCVVLVLAGLFSLIWLRSSIVSMTYSMRELEEKSMAARKDMKTLLAERAHLMAVSRITASLDTPAYGRAKSPEDVYVTPDRTRVVLVRHNTAAEPRQASLRLGDTR